MVNNTPAGRFSRINENCGIDISDGNSLKLYYFSAEMKENA